MIKISFDEEAYKTRAVDGPFKSRAAVDRALVKMDSANPAYNAWALKHDVDPSTGSIVTTAYNPDLLERRYNSLVEQLDAFTTTGPMYEAPGNLVATFEEAAAENTSDPFKVLIVSSLRENVHFDLQKKFADLNVQSVVAAVNESYANECNDLIQTKAPELAGKLVFKSVWQDQSYDLAFVNPAILYHDKLSLKDFVEDIADTCAKRVVFSGLMKNDDPDGAAQWKTQRYSGGVIPFRVPARGELAGLMEDAGYSLVQQTEAPVSFDVNKTSSFVKQNPKVDDFSFILR